MSTDTGHTQTTASLMARILELHTQGDALRIRAEKAEADLTAVRAQLETAEYKRAEWERLACDMTEHYNSNRERANQAEADLTALRAERDALQFKYEEGHRAFDEVTAGLEKQLAEARSERDEANDRANWLECDGGQLQQRAEVAEAALIALLAERDSLGKKVANREQHIQQLIDERDADTAGLWRLSKALGFTRPDGVLILDEWKKKTAELDEFEALENECDPTGSRTLRESIRWQEDLNIETFERAERLEAELAEARARLAVPQASTSGVTIPEVSNPLAPKGGASGQVRSALRGLLSACAAEGWWLKASVVQVMDAAQSALDGGLALPPQD